MRYLIRISMGILVVLLASGMQVLQPVPVSAAPPSHAVLSAAEVIAAINAYRSQNGLPAYQTNSKLMAAAQAQSDYQASIGDVTHTGPGGTRPSDRVYAVGYGDGNSVWVSEIIYGGVNATVSDAVGWWKTSTIHNDTMLSPRYLEIGAGVSSGGGMVYYTAVTGYVTGSPAPDIEVDSSGAESSEEVAPLVIPVVASEPLEDGSIVHVVRTGQSLWNIAAVYDVPMETIMELNNITENSMLQVGQEILVKSASDQISPTPLQPSETPALSENVVEDTVQPEMVPTASQTVVIETIPATTTPENPVPISAEQPGPDVGAFLAAGVVLLFLSFLGFSFTRVDQTSRK